MHFYLRLNRFFNLFTCGYRLHTGAVLKSVPILCLLPFMSVAAQESAMEEDSNWYQIELVVFEHKPNFSGENWRKKVRLYYPSRLDFLVDESSEDESMEPTVQSTDAPSNELTDNRIDSNLDLGDTQAALHTKLNEEHKALLTEAKRLSRRRGMRILFHEAWRQALTSAGDAKNILILGGNAFDDHHELEGSVSFSVSRYLHIATNLWFTKFEANTVDNFSRLEYAGENNEQFEENSYNLAKNAIPNNYFNIQLNTGFWPQLPEIPSAFPESEGEPEFNMNTSAGQTFLSDDAGLHNRNIDKSENSEFPIDDSLYSEFPSQVLAKRTLTSRRNRDSKYRPAQIIEFKQKRRMRSEELHYIDHPRLGILVKIVPYEVSDAADGIE